MKAKKVTKQRPILKVTKESKTGESSLNRAVKDVKQILKKKNVKTDVKKDAKKTVKIDNAVKDVEQILEKKNVKAVVKKDTKKAVKTENIVNDEKQILEKKNVKADVKKVAKKAVKTDNAVENVKQILEKKNVKADVKKAVKNENLIKIKGIKKKVKKLNSKKQEEPTSTDRGVIYLGHIPHGFYEQQMKGYFSQFGKVTRVRVARSENTGNSKGFGFVEFELPEVAKIAAESMNNYLMCGRLVKAEYIPPEKQHNKYFKGTNWSKGNFPKLKRLEKITKKVNRSVPNKNHEMIVKNSVNRLSKLSEKLKEQGINIPMKLGRLKV